MKNPDRQLIQHLLDRIANNDPLAFREVFNMYSGKVYAFAFKLVRSQPQAEEIVQDVFMKIWIGREALSSIKYFPSYLYKVTRNHTFNVLKRVALEASAKAILEKELSEIDIATEEGIHQRESQQILSQAIDRLPPQQRLVYSLCYHEGLKYEEVAERLNISRLTVKTHMQQALRSIKLHFSGIISIIIALLA